MNTIASIHNLDDATRLAVRARGMIVKAPAGAVLFEPGAPCQNFMILDTGTVRVEMTAESGREIVLYRIGPGETCVMTTSCLIAGRSYDVTGVAETDVTGLAIPAAAFRDLLDTGPSFRTAIFDAYARRMMDLVVLVEEVAFRRVDRRLASLLLELAAEDGRIERTHQELAHDLGTAREVVSRQLKEFARRGWIGMTRGAIRVRKRDGLGGLANDKS